MISTSEFLFMLLVLVYTGTPSLVALVVTRGRVLRGPWAARPPWPLLAAVLLGPVVVALTALLDGARLELGSLALVVAIGAPLAEELGWRGALNPWLERRVGWLTGALLTGFAWAAWHLPLAYVNHSFAFFPELASSLIAASVVIAFLHERSGHSLLVPLLAHMSLNLGLVRASDVGTLTRLLVWTALAVASAAVRARAGRPSTRGRPDMAAPASPPRP